MKEILKTVWALSFYSTNHYNIMRNIMQYFAYI